jgi:anhydro-N-acetylmuramic acid kinase
MATLTYYTAGTVFSNYRQFIEPHAEVDTVAVGGGGVKNPVLMKYLQEAFEDVPILPVSEFGIDEDFKEAIGFAVLANETLHGRPSNVPRVTGADRPAILGKMCLV